jgi:hypothetical protein
VVRADGSKAIHHLTSIVLVIEGLAHETNIFNERLAGALPKHEVVEQ